MEFDELLKVQPALYLNNGFLNDANEIKERINGYYSLAMAYRFRKEGIEPDQVKNRVDQLQITAEFKNKDEAIKEILNDPIVKDSVAMTALINAASPWLTSSNQWNAFLLHLRRIISQLVLITILYSSTA